MKIVFANPLNYPKIFGGEEQSVKFLGKELIANRPKFVERHYDDKRLNEELVELYHRVVTKDRAKVAFARGVPE